MKNSAVNIILIFTFFLLVAFVVIVSYVSLWELYKFESRSDISAQASATILFHQICIQNGYNEKTFRGPFRRQKTSDREHGNYTFEWNSGPTDSVTITVTYLPFDLTYNISTSLVLKAAH